MTFIKIYDKIQKIIKMYEFMMSGNSATAAGNFILETVQCCIQMYFCTV